jgi:hypothetical protein
MNIEERTQHMREQPLFQGMGFSKIIEFSKEESSIKIEYIAEHRHCHSVTLINSKTADGSLQQY